MARSYFSTTFDRPAGEVWAVIRDFGAYDVWLPEVDECAIEDGRPGDAVGAVRSVRIGDERIRQRLVAHSDVERSYAYEFCEPRFPSVLDYQATIRVTPVVDGDRAFVEWWATFDCPTGERDRWRASFAESFAGWLGSLRGRLAAAPPSSR